VGAEGHFRGTAGRACYNRAAPADRKEIPTIRFLFRRIQPGGRATLVRGAVQARRNIVGGNRGEVAEVAIHDLIVYTF
jgi:hypothetical protein